MRSTDRKLVDSKAWVWPRSVDFVWAWSQIGAPAPDEPEVARRGEAQAAGTKMELPKSLCVAVIDDSDQIRNLVVEMLRSFGVTSFVVAANGQEALKKMAARHPQIVIADCYMQPINGIAMTRMIRKRQTNLNPALPVIMITGHGEPDLVGLARDAGVSEVLVKPLTGDALYARVRSVLDRPRPFIRAGEFIGPDRRRRDQSFDGPEKRTVKIVVRRTPAGRIIPAGEIRR